jgi:serine/threonine protein kinase
VRIPELHSLVRGHSGKIAGLLLTYIESTSTLTCAIRPGTPICLRERWARQITETLYNLHDAGIVWGDAKPDNILVDTETNVWAIDFGGGYTEGWVDKELAETILGDQQGLSKIIEFIHSG